MPHENLTAWVDLIARVLIIVIPVLLTWFIQSYVKGAKSEKDVAAIVRLTNVAIDYVENLDKQGALGEMPSDVSKGLQKLNLATDWLETELQERHGIKISNEQATQWINAEFQKRIGSVQQVSELAKLAKSAVETVQSLENSGLIQLPPDADRLTVLTDLAADWLIAQLADKTGASVSLEEARAWVRKEFMERLQTGAGGPDNGQPDGDRLTTLAQQAVRTVETLRKSGVLKIKPGQSASEVDKNVAAAWLVVDVTKQGLDVSLDDISAAVEVAFQE
jgi:hypothetical protein